MYRPASLFLLLVFSIVYTHTFGQEQKPFTIGFETSIESKKLGETRPLLIHLPDSYEESDKSYPVIYLMDGKGHFLHTTGTMQFLSRNQRMPEMIIVGIPNTGNRTRDLTPLEVGDQKRFPTAGGADNMLTFIGDELMPYINKTYRTSDFSTLIGHSFGGLFAIHALVNHPGLFDAYLAISPSLWWNDQELVGQAEEHFTKNPDQEARLYMTMGNEGGDMLGGAWKLSAILKETNPDGISWNFKLMEEETHGSVPHRSTYDGLEMLFKDWQLSDLYDVYKSGGFTGVEKAFKKRREIYGSGAEYASENQINQLGYQLLNNKEYAVAITVFKENVKNHPESANTYDSLAEALQKS
ncbi:MAG: alpha/beta hydrolase-fold protein [Bacteroidota bacterium]